MMVTLGMTTQGRTPFLRACTDGSVEDLKLLVAAGADIFGVDGVCDTLDAL